MFYVLQNESTAALRRVPILLTDAATGTTAQAGVALTNIYPYVNVNGGAFTGGTGSVAESGFGQYYYQMDVNETATLGLAGIHVTAAGCRNYDAIAQIAAFNVYSPSAGGGATAGDIWSYVLSNASSADANLVAAAAGGGVTAGDIWDYDLNSYLATTQAGSLLNETYTKVNNNLDTTISGVPTAVWTTNLSLGYIVPDAGAYLYELGIGATGFTPAGGGGITAGDVWNYTLTSSSATADATIGNIDTNVTTIQGNTSNIPGSVWDSQVGSYTTSGSFGLQLLRSDISGIAGSVTVWTGAAYNGVYADAYRIDGSYAASTALKDILTGIGSSITSNITGDLSGSVGSVTNDVNVSTGSMTGIADTVWSYATRTLTSGSGITSGEVSDAVWNSPVASYSTNGTFGKNILRADQANKVGDVTLYSVGGTNGVDADIHRIANDQAAATALKNILTGIGASITSNITGNLSGSVDSVTSNVSLSTATQASIANSVWLTDVTSYPAPSAGEDLATAAVGGISPADVWTYASRTITGGLADTVTTLTNRSGFAITGGTITTVSDKTGYSLSSPQTFDLTGNITGSVSGSVGSVSGAVGSVTGAVGSVTGNVGGNVVGSVASVTSPVSITTAAMGSIGSTVWNYVLSDAQTADANLVAAGSAGVALTAGDIWTYNPRTLTSGAGITVIGAVQLVNGPYRLTSNQNNSDGVLDILQNSVQEINLNLIDGNGAPASTAGYASIVNIFDVAGTAVTSYTPTVEYADGGVLTFQLDTDVTATIGRYNLIVGLSGAGFNVKYGPLQILVRPL